MGDLNSPSINWESMSPNNEDLQLLIFHNNFLTEFVHESIRKQNIFDIILGSEENIVSDVCGH